MDHIIRCKLVYYYADFTTSERTCSLMVEEGTTQDDPDLDSKIRYVLTSPEDQGKDWNEWVRAHNSRRWIASWFELPNGRRINDYDPTDIDPEDAKFC